MRSFVPSFREARRGWPISAGRLGAGLVAAMALATAMVVAIAVGRFLTAAIAALITLLLSWQVARWYLRAKRLQSRLDGAELDLLGSKLQPHFLFNTLNAVSALMHEDVGAADEMLTALGSLLSSAFEADGTPEVPVRREVELMRHYLSIMRRRYGDRFAATVHVDDEAGDALVPAFVLQPLVENALRHGLGRPPAHGRLEIRVERRQGYLGLRVTDDGAGLPPNWDERRKQGIGLRVTRARLRRLYGASHHLELRNRPGGGVEVQVIVPYRSAQAWRRVS